MRRGSGGSSQRDTEIEAQGGVRGSSGSRRDSGQRRHVLPCRGVRRDPRQQTEGHRSNRVRWIRIQSMAGATEQAGRHRRAVVCESRRRLQGLASVVPFRALRASPSPSPKTTRAPLGASFSGVAGGMFASRRDGYWRVHALAASLPCHRRADSRGALTTYESRKPVAINSRYAHSQQRSGIARTEDIGLRSACRTQPERRRAGPTLPSMQGRPGYFEKADENTTACSFPWPLDRARAHQTVEHQSTGKPAHALQDCLQRHEPKDDCRDPPVRDTSDRRVGRRGWVDLPPVDHALVKACTPPAGSARSRVGLQSPHWGHRRDAGRHCARA